MAKNYIHAQAYEQAEELTNLRYKLGVSIKDLAAEFGCSVALVSKWCCGCYRCDVEKVKAAMKRIVVRRYEEVMRWE